MAQVTIIVDYEENGEMKRKSVELMIDKDVHQEVYAQWSNIANGGYELDGVGGRPNDRE